MVKCFVSVPPRFSTRSLFVRRAVQPRPLHAAVPQRRSARLPRRSQPTASNSVVVDVSSTDDLADNESALASVESLRSDATGLVSAAVKGEDAELSVLLCSDAFIADLNAKWRNIENPTDVLSFPQGDGVVGIREHAP